MGALPKAREALGYELSSDWGRSYSVILGHMVGLDMRSADSSRARQKTMRNEVAGMRRSLVLILGVERDMPEAEAAKQIKVHEMQWRKATEEDESAMRDQD